MHNTPVKIVKVKYNSYKNNGAYPQYIAVEMSDGKTVRYER